MSHSGNQQRSEGGSFRIHDIEKHDERNEVTDGGPLVPRSSSSMKTHELPKWFFRSWRIIFGVSCVIAVALDPLFFYVPVINEDKKCIGLDKKLGTLSLILRSLTDMIGIINIILQFRNVYKDETSGKVVKDFWKIARRYLWPYFVIDILVILPFPQVIILIIFRQLKGSNSLNKRKLLTFFVLFQYVPRVIQIFQSWKNPKKRVDKLSETPKRVKAAFNFFLYIIASHVLGAFWYFLSIERQTACWHMACENHIGCTQSSFNCDDRLHSLGNYTFLNDFCPINPPDTTLFDFGIFFGALRSGVVQSKNFSEKFFQCFWWGLQNLSSLGQNLQTSNYVWENCFAVLISLFGLLLFTYFIGNLQLDSATSEEEKKKKKEDRKKKQEREREQESKKKEEESMKTEEKRMEMEQKTEMEKKKRTIGIWMFKYRLPVEMKKEIMQNVVRRLERKKDVIVGNLLRHLPEELSNSVKRHIYLDLLKRVPALQNMDEQLLLKICDSLKPIYYNEQSYIVREGDPIDAMFFITDGVAWSYSTSNNGEAISGSSSLAERLEKGNFFGGELLEFVLKTPSLPKLAVSPRTVKTHGPVEGFALMAEDLKNIVSKNWKCVGKGQLEHFAAHVVQAAWRRHHEYKNLEKSSQGGR